MSWLPGTQSAEPWRDHVPHQPHRVEDARPTVHEVADEDRLAALGMGIDRAAPERIGRLGRRPRRRSPSRSSSSSSSSQQPWTSPMMSNGPCSSRRSFQSGTRSTVAASTSSGSPARRRAGSPPCCSPRSDRRSCDVCWRTTCGPNVPVGPAPVPLLADPLGQVEHDGHRQAVVLPGQLDQRLAGLGLDVGGVDHRQPPQGQPLAGDEVQHLEGILRDGLIVLVVADHPPAGVRREDLGRQEVLAGERALARPAGADQDDEGELGDLERHWHLLGIE